MRIKLFCLAVVLIAAGGQWSDGHLLQRQVRNLTNVASRQDNLIGPIDLGDPVTKESSDRAHAHPHGDKVCASGCALSRHPTPRLSPERFESLIRRLASRSSDQKAMDELLFYGPQALARLRTMGSKSGMELPDGIRNDLDRELSRSHGIVSLRLISETGDVLADLPEQTVPLDLRHEFDLRENGIPPLLASGTIKRVGEYRLWSRL